MKGGLTALPHAIQGWDSFQFKPTDFYGIRSAHNRFFFNKIRILFCVGFNSGWKQFGSRSHHDRVFWANICPWKEHKALVGSMVLWMCLEMRQQAPKWHFWQGNLWKNQQVGGNPQRNPCGKTRWLECGRPISRQSLMLLGNQHIANSAETPNLQRSKCWQLTKHPVL